MKRTVRFLPLVLLFMLPLMGMSGMGGTAEEVSSPFAATLEDSTGATMELQNVVIDGKPLFAATVGKGRLQIPFDKIAEIRIIQNHACVTLVDGKQICKLKVSGISRLSGVTEFGAYRIPLKDVAWIKLVEENQ